MFTKAYDSSPVLTQNLTEAKKLIQRAGTTGKTITIGVAAVVKVPYTATNQPHTLTITLVDEDGNGVSPFVPDGVPDPGPIRGELSFNLGRPGGPEPRAKPSRTAWPRTSTSAYGSSEVISSSSPSTAPR